MSDQDDLASTGYKARKFQDVLHRSMLRFNVLVCHRRFGKTVFSINHMIDRALRNPLDRPQYAYIAPNYGQAKRIVWDMLKSFVKNIPGIETNEADLRLDIPRPDKGDQIRFYLLGAENPGSIRGIHLDGVILDEFAEMDTTVWPMVIRPALSDRHGWAIFIGTPKGQNQFFDIYQTALKNKEHGWFSAIYRASETGVLPASELEANKRELPPEVYEQEYECSFTAALTGSYYGKLIEEAEKDGRITNVAYDPALPVDTFWDLGIGDTTAIWFLQQLGVQYRLIDYIEQSGVGLDWYVRELQRRQYVYRDHTLPHDAAARELGTGKSRQETLWGYGLRQTIIMPRHRVEDGINAGRMLIPKCWFDRVKCERGLAALRNYQKKWDAKNQIWSDKPLHDWASNGADAFRVLAMGNRPEGRRQEPLRYQEEPPHDIYGGI